MSEDDSFEESVMGQIDQLRDDIHAQWVRDVAHLNHQAADAAEAVDKVMVAEFVEHDERWLEKIRCDRHDLHSEHPWEHRTKGTVLCAGNHGSEEEDK